MSFVTKENEWAVVKVPGAYRFTLCPGIEKEVKAYLMAGCSKVKVDLEKTEILTSAAIRQLKELCQLVEEKNFSLINAAGWVMGTIKANKLEGWLRTA